MNDRNHFDLGTSATGPSGWSDRLFLLERLEDLRGVLRAAGVVRVLVAYEQDSLGMVFADSGDNLVKPPNLEKQSDELAVLMAVVIRRRCPPGLSPRSTSGTISWHLVQDTLVHEQTVKFTGL